jgi:hypothetical protein
MWRIITALCQNNRRAADKNGSDTGFIFIAYLDRVASGRRATAFSN